ncbi:MAG: GIY-YIG nuclease family protein [Alphaproteobacteria bacterium]|nr:GIY-YIG nuclease family protein [Alphaproteobacteria bacterium]
MKEKEEKKGKIVYILTNESMSENTLKIGITHNLKERMGKLFSTSVPLPFECYYALEFESEETARNIEKQLHKAFTDKRINKNREFFDCPPEQAKAALSIASGRDVTPTEPVVEKQEDTQALDSIKRKKANIDYFGALGINAGQILTFSGYETLTCEVQENGKVIFEDELTSLSGSALRILQNKGYALTRAQGANYWCYKGETLLNLYQQSKDS